MQHLPTLMIQKKTNVMAGQPTPPNVPPQK